MSCFIVLTVAHTLGSKPPAHQERLERSGVAGYHAVLPHEHDPKRPRARSVVNLKGGGVRYVIETDSEIDVVPCVGGQRSE